MEKERVTRVLVDARHLLSPVRTGVHVYTLEVLKHLKRDRSVSITLFAPSWKPKDLPKELKHLPRVSLRIPSKILKLLFWLKLVRIEHLAGKAQQFDEIWLPNREIIHSNLPITLTVHDLSPTVSPHFFPLKHRLLWSLSIKRLMNTSTRFLCVSESTKQDLMHLFSVPSSAIFVTPLAASQQFSFKGQASDRTFLNLYPTQKPYLLYLGTLEPRKNIESIVEAFEILKQEDSFTDLQLLLAGSKGWKTKNLFKQIETSPQKQSIHLLGYVKDSHKPALFRHANAVLFPSFYEGFGLPVLEGMQSGAVVIHSSIKALMEVAGDSTIPVDPFNIHDLVNGIKDAQNKHIRSTLKQRGSKRSKQFSWETTAKLTAAALTS